MYPQQVSLRAEHELPKTLGRFFAVALFLVALQAHALKLGAVLDDFILGLDTSLFEVTHEFSQTARRLELVEVNAGNLLRLFLSHLLGNWLRWRLG